MKAFPFFSLLCSTVSSLFPVPHLPTDCVVIPNHMFKLQCYLIMITVCSSGILKSFNDGFMQR